MSPKKNKTSTKSKSKKEFKLSLGLLVLILMGVFIFGDLLYLAKLWATPPKGIPVQTVMTINGETSPSGVFKCWDAVTSASNFYLSDQPNNRIVVFDRQGRYIDSITNKQAGKPEFKEISCLTMDSNGNIYVMDCWNALIRGFNSQRKPLPIINIANKGFFGARGLAYSNGYFLVADTGSQRIVKVSPQGDPVTFWGRHGSGKVEFDNPYQVIADDQDRYYVADRDNHRIQCLDSKGKFLWDISTYWPPIAEAIDKTNHLLYVSTDQTVRVYDLAGKLLGVLASVPKSEDAFTHINALSIFPDGDILACRGNSITIYHPLPPVAAKK